MSQIDTSILPTPTGRAAELAAQHGWTSNGTAPTILSNKMHTLYGAWFCPFVQRVWIVLYEKRIPYTYVEINPYRKEDRFLSLNPRGLVPTLAVPSPPSCSSNHPPKPLYESFVICQYLDDAFPSPSYLLPSTQQQKGDGNDIAYLRARCLLWIDHISTRVVPSFYRLLQHVPAQSPYSLASARSKLQMHIRAFAQELLENDGDGPFFLGQKFGMVDIALAPWAKRLFLIDHYKRPEGAGIPPADYPDEDGAIWRRWQLWLDAVVERESVKATWSDDDKYIEVYRRYAEDTTGSEVGKATREGRALP